MSGTALPQPPQPLHCARTVQMYGLLDNAWDSYTSFCSASVGSGGSSIAALVSAATAAATKARLPSCASVEEGKQQLQDKQQEADLLRRKLNAAVGTAGMLQDQLTDAEAAKKAAAAGKAHEAKLLDELWQVFQAFRTKIGYTDHNGYQVSKYIGSNTVSKDFAAAAARPQMSLPGLQAWQQRLLLMISAL